MTAPPSPRPVDSRAPKMIAYWVMLAVFLVTDVVTKQIAERTLLLHQPRPVFGDWVQFTLAYNRGAAFSMHVGDASRWVFSIIAIVVLFMLWRMLRESQPGDTWRGAALGMVSAGAVGNLLDRLRSERGVVDFLDVGVGSWRFYTFNVADMGVTVGAVLLALSLFAEGRRLKKHEGVGVPPAA
jgi:signal peptidase II